MFIDPVLIAYSVKRTAKGRTAWTRIGAAYPHETGAGLSVILDAIPPDGRIVLVELDADDHERLRRGAKRGTRQAEGIRQGDPRRSGEPPPNSSLFRNR